MKRNTLLVTVTVLALLLLAAPAFAQGDPLPPTDPELPDTLPGLLNLSVLIGLVYSVVLSNIPAFENADANTKKVVVGVITVLFGAALAGIDYFVSADAIEQADVAYQAALPLLRFLLMTFVGGGSVFVVGQTAHASGEIAQGVRSKLQQ